MVSILLNTSFLSFIFLCMPVRVLCYGLQGIIKYLYKARWEIRSCYLKWTKSIPLFKQICSGGHSACVVKCTSRRQWKFTARWHGLTPQSRIFTPSNSEQIWGVRGEIAVLMCKTVSAIRANAILSSIILRPYRKIITYMINDLGILRVFFLFFFIIIRPWAGSRPHVPL